MKRYIFLPMRMKTRPNNDIQIGASHKNFIAVQNANTARDMAAKIREDPLLAIKQQEQAAYQALMSNPLRLKELQEKTGMKIKDKKDKKEKKDKRDKKEKKSRKDKHREEYDDYRDYDRRRRSSRSISPRDSYSRRYRSPSPVRGDRYSRADRTRSRSPPPRRRSRSRDDDYRQSNGHDSYQESADRRRSDRVPRYHDSDVTSSDDRRRSRSSERRRPSNDYGRRRERSRTPPTYNKRARMSPPPSRRLDERPPPRGTNGSTSAAAYSTSAEDRAARLAAMTSNASSLTVERKERLEKLLAEEKAELEAEDKLRVKSGGMGSFLSQEQKKVFSGVGGIEERIRRGRSGMVAAAE